MDFFSGLHILVPVDFSVESRRAVDHAIQLADRPNHAHVLHVCPLLILYEPAAVFVLREDEIRDRYGEVFKKHFPPQTYGEIQCDLQFGDPGTQIAIYAATHHMGLIVMPTHGRTGLDRLLMGRSRSERCGWPHARYWCFAGTTFNPWLQGSLHRASSPISSSSARHIAT